MMLGKVCKLRSWASLSNEFGTDEDGDIPTGRGYAWNFEKKLFSKGKRVKIESVANGFALIKDTLGLYMTVSEAFFIP